MKEYKRDKESGGNHTKSTEKKVEVVCDEKRGRLRRKEMLMKSWP